MTFSAHAPDISAGEATACGDRAGRMALCGELAAGLNETMELLGRLEADLGPDIAPFALPLRRALTDLCGRIDRAMGFLMEAAMEEPAPAAGTVDQERFDRLLEIAGPDTAAELLHRMFLDLRAVRERLADALEATLWADIRAQTHVLLSLSGTVGALEVQRLSEAMNAAAHRQDREAMLEQGPLLLGRLDELLAYVAGRRSTA